MIRKKPLIELFLITKMPFDLLDNLIQIISFIMTSKLKDPNSDVNWLITLSPENKLIARF